MGAVVDAPRSVTSMMICSSSDGRGSAQRDYPCELPCGSFAYGMDMYHHGVGRARDCAADTGRVTVS